MKHNKSAQVNPVTPSENLKITCTIKFTDWVPGLYVLQKTMKLLTLTLLLLSSCWAHAQDHKGKLIFSIKLIESDEQVIDKDGNETPYPQPKIKDGVYFYLEKENVPTVTGFQYRGGKFKSLAGLGSVRTEKFLTELDAIGFEAFDFQALINEKNYELEYLTLGGAKYEIFIDYRGAKFSFVEWNPHQYIETYAKMENKVEKLQAFIDRLALMYGRRQFGL